MLEPVTSNDRTAGRPKGKRAERNRATRRALFAAAAKIVGQHGYADASVARITAAAGVAQGTFYTHFANRQELLEQLLPAIGNDMLVFIGDRTRKHGPELTKELDRFRAFFEFLREVPEFLRILNEAESFAPTGYKRHIETTAEAYERVLRRARDAGELAPFPDEEIETLVHILMGAREYLSRRYAYGPGQNVTALPDHVLSSYRRLLTGGLFRARAHVPGA